MTGFYTTTPKGDVLHIRGDIKMSDRTLHVITHMFDLATRQAIGSIHHEARYQAALAPSINSGRSFVNTVEPTACGGLATAYRNKAGESLTTLEEVVRALLAGELAA